MDNTVYSDELQHGGIRGMKWGVRRYQNKDGTLTAAGQKRARKSESEDYKKVSEIRKKKISQMSNQELRDANNRLNLEKQYKDLTRKKNVGQKAVTAFIATAGTITAVEGAANTYKRVGKMVLNKIGKVRV